MKIKWNWGTKLVIAIVAFMLMIIAFGIYMASNKVSLVEPDYYPRGQAYQDMIEHIQNTIPYASDIQVHNDNGTIRIAFPDFFRPDAVEGSVHFYHRTSDLKDEYAKLELSDEGVFSFPVEKMNGRYIIKIEWKQDEVGYYTEKDLFIE